MTGAIGLIEAIGFTSAVAAVDAASKAANITLIGIEKIIGVEQLVGVNIQIAGEVAAVQAAVQAGVEAGNRVGKIAASKVIARPHEEVAKLIEKFAKNLNIKEEVVPEADVKADIKEVEKKEKTKK